MTIDKLDNLGRIAVLSNSENEFLIRQDRNPFAQYLSPLSNMGANGRLFCSSQQLKSFYEMLVGAVKDGMKQKGVLKNEGGQSK